MIIVGIDPGTARVGWAAIQESGSKINVLSYGCITTPIEKSPELRLLTIYEELTKILTKYKPTHLALEDLFFTSNAKTIIPVGQARGVILLAAAQKHIPVTSYSPPAIKRAITGDGKADKSQVNRMVMRILHLDTPPKPDDTADAIAIALTHAYSYKLKGKIS